MMAACSESSADVELLEETDFQYQKQTQQDATGISDEALRIFMVVIFGALCQIISIFGIVTNIINFICFLKQGFKDRVNISLLGLAVSDIGSLINLMGLNVMYNPAVMTADLEFDVMDVTYMIFATPHMAFTGVSSCITALTTVERCFCVTATLQINSFASPRKMFVTVAIIYVILLFCTAPVYAVNRLGMTFSPIRNKTILGRVFMANREKVESISFVISNFVIPVTAFAIILICTVTLVIKLQRGNVWRRNYTASNHVYRVSCRNQKVAKMVVMISALFIVCFTPICILMLLAALEPAISFNGKYIKGAIFFFGLGFFLESINSSCNIFIYIHMSSKYRETFLNMFNMWTFWSITK